MNTALTVYVVIFVALAIPLGFILINACVSKSMPRAARLRNMVCAAAALVVLAALCPTLYFITINRQPMLVIQRVVTGLAQGNDAYLLEKNLITEAGLQSAGGEVTQRIGQGAQFAIGNKTQRSEADNSVFAVQPDGAPDCLILAEVAQTPSQSTVVNLRLVTGDEAAELIAKDAYQPFN